MLDISVPFRDETDASSLWSCSGFAEPESGRPSLPSLADEVGLGHEEDHEDQAGAFEGGEDPKRCVPACSLRTAKRSSQPGGTLDSFRP
mgnify:CR=1 FL=1